MPRPPWRFAVALRAATVTPRTHPAGVVNPFLETDAHGRGVPRWLERVVEMMGTNFARAIAVSAVPVVAVAVAAERVILHAAQAVGSASVHPLARESRQGGYYPCYSSTHLPLDCSEHNKYPWGRPGHIIATTYRAVSNRTRIGLAGHWGVFEGGKGVSLPAALRVVGALA